MSRLFISALCGDDPLSPRNNRANHTKKVVLRRPEERAHEDFASALIFLIRSVRGGFKCDWDKFAALQDWVYSDHLVTTCLLLGTNVHLECDSDRYIIPELCHDGDIPYLLDQD